MQLSPLKLTRDCCMPVSDNCGLWRTVNMVKEDRCLLHILFVHVHRGIMWIRAMISFEILILIFIFKSVSLSLSFHRQSDRHAKACFLALPEHFESQAGPKCLRTERPVKQTNELFGVFPHMLYIKSQLS